MDPPAPSRRRLLFAAVTGSGMLTGIYWIFPPIFADVESATPGGAAPAALVRSAALERAGGEGFPELPDLLLTPSIEAHRRSITLLEEGVRRLRRVRGYTAELARQEVVEGRLADPQRMTLKLRHEPFSVYMKWLEGAPGQEVLYVEGEHEGNMIVRASGWKGRLGPMKLDPYGRMAMAQSRHPITQCGLLNLAERILEARYTETSWSDGYDCIEELVEFEGRPCHRFTTVYHSTDVRADYRKSVIYIDQALLYVAKIENYGWPGRDVPSDRLDAETLLETYAYTNINFETQLAAVDFSTANGEYGLRRR
jgi:hypothetical protein